MNHLTAEFFHWLPAASLQGALIIGGLLLLRALTGHRLAAAWWRWLWALALLRLLAPVFVLPPHPLALPAVVDRGKFQTPNFKLQVNSNAQIANIQMPPVPPMSAVESLSAPAVTVSGAKALPWGKILPAVWLAGAWCGGVLLVSARWRLHRRLQRQRRPVDETVGEWWRDHCQRLGVKHPPVLCRSAAVTSPALVGICAPKLLLPEHMPDNFSRADWEHLFAHELAHYRRGDHWLNAAWLLALTVHWFNPLAWLGYRRLRADRELAADEWALRRLGADGDAARAAAYGDTLLKLATVSGGGGASVALIGILENHAQLRQRLRRIVSGRPRTVAATVGGLLIVGAAAAFIIGRQPQRAHAEFYPDLTPTETLLAAAANGDLPMVKQLLRAGVSVSAAERARTPLMAAASNGRAKVVALLLRRGADPNLAPHPSQPPLWLAWRAGHADVAKQLLAAGAKSTPELDATLSGDLEPLRRFAAQPKPDVNRLRTLAQIAAINGAATSCAFLIDQVRVLSGDGHWDPGRDILPAVVANGRRDTLQVLFDRGQDVAGQGVVNLSVALDRRPDLREWLAARGVTAPAFNDGERLVDAAFRGDVPELARLLQRGADVNYHGENDWTPLTKAASVNQLPSVKFLLARGADPNATHYQAHTALSMTNNVKIADLLFAAGAAVKPEFLSYASRWGGPDLIKWYLAHGVNPNQPPPGRREPNYLFDVGGAELVKIYVEAGADPNARDEYGNTPLMRARSAAIVDALVAAGADVRAKNKGGENVLEANYFSYPYRSPDVLQALVKHGVKFDPRADGPFLLLRAAIANNTGLAKYLLDAGVDPNTPGRLNRQEEHRAAPLRMCVTDGSYDVAKLLLERGATVSGEQRGALSSGQPRLVKLFWEHGARELPALSYAVSQGATVSELQQLVNDGAAVNPPVADGADRAGGKLFAYTVRPLYVAAQFGQLDAVQFLLDHGADLDETVTAAAAGDGQDEVLALLLQRGAQATVGAVTQAASGGQRYRDRRAGEHFERCVRLLLDAGALTDAQPRDIGRLLYVSIFNCQPDGNPAILQLLLDAGCDPNSPLEFSDGKKVWLRSPSLLEHCRAQYQKMSGDKNGEYYARQLKPSLDLLEAYAKPAR
ncbi:MAG: ankyrin repeat domain-containing protein [Verrucomicrobiales bacterium]|jgi:ankyrin repeat protein/beta-lactamase regulating signal transducer with metallopeptidase domain|nr:ankyrin repeat domain-containing protein [Verrucomicrobiales bacterium]